MEKRITSNSVQSWVTKIVTMACRQPWFFCRQPSAHRGKSESKCYVIDWFIGTIAERSEYCAVHTTWCRWRAVRCKKQYRDFALINHRQGSSLGFWTLCAKKQSTGFYEQILWVYYILADFCWYYTSATSQNPAVDFLVLRKSVVLSWKVISKAALPQQTLFFQARCVTELWYFMDHLGECAVSLWSMLIKLACLFFVMPYGCCMAICFIICCTLSPIYFTNAYKSHVHQHMIFLNFSRIACLPSSMLNENCVYHSTSLGLSLFCFAILIFESL